MEEVENQLKRKLPNSFAEHVSSQLSLSEKKHIVYSEK